MLLLDQNTTNKKQIDKILEFDAGNTDSKEYKMKVIWDNADYVMESKSVYLLNFFYLVAWKSYLEEKNTWKLVMAVLYLGKLINLLHQDNFQNLPAIFLPINYALPIAILTVKLTRLTKRKQGRLANSINK